MDQKQKYDYILIGLFVVLVGVICGFLYFLFFFNLGSDAEPTPIPPLETDDSWQRVQARGTLYVGTSADYPPFAYYTGEYQLDGFDVQMMREIGQRLGVEVEFSDIVFDTLGESLVLRQVDTAVSAISITEERSQSLDFTNVYFVSKDVFLAPVGTTYTVQTVQDVASRRVGVQRATVFESYLRTLVDDGVMPASNLFVYEKATDAVRDLNQARLDLVMLDEPPANIAIGNNQGRKAGEGINPQRLAMAVPKGADALRTELNRVLQDMFNDGRIHALAQQYLGVPPDQVLPTPTVPSQATAVPTATAQACVNGMQFVEDINLDDQNMTNPPQMPPGTPFTKVWRIRNTGSCTWDSRYYLDYVSGNSPEARMNGQATAIVGTVPPGAVYDIAVNMVSPIIPGTYQGFWAMHNPELKQFGERIWVGITVPGPPTATPLPTQTPNPSINFVVDKTQIVAGECVNFSWNVRGAQAVYFYTQGDNWQNYPVNHQVTNRLECPQTTTTYELRVNWPNGSVEIRPQPITVLPAPEAPVITSFALNPPYQVELNQCVAISWSVAGEVDNVQLLTNGIILWDGAPSTGNFQDCPNSIGQVSYSLIAQNKGGESRAQEYITVVPASTAVPTALPTATGAPTTAPTALPSVTPSPPIIESFSASPEEIFEGDCVQVSWRVSGNATLIQIFRNSVVVGDRVGFTGTVRDCLTEAGVVTYRIEASNDTGANAFDETFVTVKPRIEEGLPLQNTNWKLEFYYDGVGALVSVLEGSEITAVFSNDDKVNGSGGCNTYAADYQFTETNLTIGAVSLTGMTCSQPDGVMAQEQAYINILRTSATYRIVGDTMEVKDSGGQVILRYIGAE